MMKNPVQVHQCLQSSGLERMIIGADPERPADWRELVHVVARRVRRTMKSIRVGMVCRYLKMKDLL